MRFQSFTSLAARSAILFALAIGLGAAATLEAQRPIAGFPRSDQSDVAGPIVTSADQISPMFAEPGTAHTMSCPVAWGVRTAADRESYVHDGNLLRLVSNGGASRATRAEADALLAALAPPQNRQATRAARSLIRETNGLLATVRRIDPASPGVTAATRLARSVSAYNEYVDVSDAVFLATPPVELTEIRALLNGLVIASLENHGRAADLRSVDAHGLACAGVTSLGTTPLVPVAPERAIEICVVSDRTIRNVAALLQPETGDTLTLVAGERRRFTDVYPQPQVPRWLALREPVQINGSEYRPFGVSRVVRPGELSYAGAAGGAEYYVGAAEPTAPSLIYFAVGSDCHLQPYRDVSTIRVRG
jgi:hypothetical protein